MLKGFVRLAACAASGAAFLALTGCGGAAPDDSYAGPPPSSYDRDTPAPTLMGQPGPARTAPDGLAGGPRGFTGMAPIPNPGDLTRAERVRFYGHKYDYLPEPKGPSAGAYGGAPRFQLVTRRKADGTLQISMRPIANPEDMTAAERRRVYGNRYAPRAVAATPRRSWRAKAAAPVAVTRPAAVRAAPAPAVKPAPRPVAVAPLTPAAPVPAVQAAPAKPKLTPVQQLQAAVSAPINRGASLSVPADLKAGKEADVVLSLPGDLLAMVQDQAARLGLGKAAKKVNAYANLQGQGYAINPPGQQTAPVAAGKPTTFTWKVKPTEGEKTPLKADYGLELNGAKPRTTFSVGSLEEAVAAPVEAARSAAKGFKLPSFKMPSLSLKALAFPWAPEPTLPGVGKVARESVVGGALALLALILLVVLARGAGANRARAERRRKFRTMQDYGVNEPDHDAHAADHTANHGYVNPMIAAAAGAAGGYALASHGHDDHGHGGHDDHGHGHDDHAPGHDDHGHGHDDHGHGGHDDHGHGPAHTSHDAHGHDDHGHGHDDHGHGHDDHGHGGHDGHAGDGHGHDDHGHGAHTALASHGHDDHGHGGHEDHGHGDHGHDDGHGGHGDGHGHDDHGHGPAQHISHGGHDDHGHGHGHDDHGHGHDDHGHGHDDGHGHDAHHREPEHAH